MISKYLLFLAICLASLFFAACTEHEPSFPPGGWYYYHKAHGFLINGTNGLLHYKSITVISGNVTKTFEISLLPNDTLFVGETPIDSPNDFLCWGLFEGAHVIVKDDNGDTLSNSASSLYGCGRPKFVLVETDESVETSMRLTPTPIFSGEIYNFLWTIDSAYIADMSCKAGW